jgi:murein L,D-transpeptidase YcbB/YkuD
VEVAGDAQLEAGLRVRVGVALAQPRRRGLGAQRLHGRPLLPPQQLQDALVQFKYMTKEQVATGPGIYGPKTEAAVKKFQADHKVPTTGFYGELTHAALKRELAKLEGEPPKRSPGFWSKLKEALGA